MIASEVAGEAEILTLCVAPDIRRKSVGSRLLTHLVNRLRQQGAETLFLEVSETNEAAQKLYRKCGFETIGRRAAYYQSANGPIDALIMRLDLAV